MTCKAPSGGSNTLFHQLMLGFPRLQIVTTTSASGSISRLNHMTAAAVEY